MKVTLEFEEQDLREMLTEYFRVNGFAIKNLDEVCHNFTVAFPTGLAVQAEIVPQPSEAQMSAKRATPQEPADDFDVPTEEEEENPVLTADELFDSTPRRGRVERITAKEDKKIVDLLQQSKDIENSRRK